MKKLLLALVILIFFAPTKVLADPPDQLDNQETYVRAEVTKVIGTKTEHISGSTIIEETLQVRLLEGRENGKVVTVSRSAASTMTANQLTEGDKVVIDQKPDPTGKMTYAVYEPYRLDKFWFVLLGFVALIVFIGGRKGAGAFIGLCLSLLIINYWIIPQIIQGADPVQTIIVGACVILIVTTYIAHGFSLKTTVAVLGTASSLALTGWLSGVLINALHLFGLGSEDIYQLQMGTSHALNTQGLLLGGILIGTLGALNDITTTQSITMFTLIKENPRQKFDDLFGKGMGIGKEHIASLVNTLVLAYAGSSLGIFIFFSLNPGHLPWWVILNNETTMEEIAKTIIGSTGLILAVPLTTFLAAFVALRGTTFPNFLFNLSKELGLNPKPQRKQS